VAFFRHGLRKKDAVAGAFFAARDADRGGASAGWANASAKRPSASALRAALAADCGCIATNRPLETTESHSTSASRAEPAAFESKKRMATPFAAPIGSRMANPEET